MKPSMPPLFPSLLMSLGLAHVASAALLVNETYDNYATVDFPGTGTTPFTGPATNAFGLTGNYIINNPGGGSGYSFVAGGLAFADYNTNAPEGRMLVYRSNTGGTTIAAQLNISSSVTGTLYSSQLINVQTAGSLTSGFTESRIASASGTPGADTRFRTQFDSSISNQAGPGVSYSGNPTTSPGTTALSTNTTYMVISSFTRVGESLSAGTPGTATVYVLDANQYQDFKTAGFSQTYLDTGTVTARFTGDSSTSVDPLKPNIFESGNFVQIGGINTSNGVTHIDALKYGTDLLSVVTIPEPSAAALVLLGSIAGFARRRRH